MSLNNLDINKRSLVKSHKLAFDQDKMWLDINHELSKKKKKRRLLLFFAFLLFASFSTLFIFKNQSHQYKSRDFSDYSINDFINLPISKLPNTITDICPESEPLTNSAPPSTKLIQKHASTRVLESFTTPNHISDQAAAILEKFDSLYQTNINTNLTKAEPLPMLEFSEFLNISNVKSPNIIITQNHTLKHKLFWNMGIGYVARALKSDNTDESAELRDLRNETENVLEQISLGIEYKYITDSKLTYGLGIQLRQITETFQHRYLLSEDLGSLDNFAMSKVTAYDYNNYNEYRFADFSTSIGYHFDLKKHINLYFDAGVSYTLVSNYNGDNLGQNLKPQHVNETKYFANQVQSNLNAVVSYNLSKNYAISFSSTLNIGLTGFRPQNSMLTQRYNIYSANIGIIRSFGQ
jgi:hypothetical protein